ncbi:GAF domain-containing protein [Burkholderia sp. Ax-1724]|uniref:aspartate racemase/maleate isomerase family protein n=1 Tax=Burkholderia sp. Ax-1724 TaxID=2608336 RepID=UPI00141EC18C|nr:GAF domain-containing protein [Burkholderia sp. Ax-1724]
MSNTIKQLARLSELKKIGFLTPSSNSALEPVTAAMTGQISNRVSTHYSRVPVRSLTLGNDDIGQFKTDTMVESAALLGHAKLDAILWNGTSGSWTGKGLEADQEIVEQIQHATGIPASTTSLAQLEAFRHYGIKHYGLAVPYVEEPTNKIVETYGKEGIKAVKTARLELTENVVIGNVPFDRIRQLLRDADSPDAECIVVACTNLPATVVVDEMEAELGKPIFDSIAVTLWKALQMTSIDTPLHGWGKLLRDDPVLAQLEPVMASLREATGASRTTLRIDVPAHNCHVDTVCAESVAKGIPPLKLNSSLNQRSLATVQWLERNHKPLVQDDCANAEFKPPQALMDIYGVKAQMLIGMQSKDGNTMGWISVHNVGSTRQWRDTDVAALESAAQQVQSVLQKSGWASFGS